MAHQDQQPPTAPTSRSLPGFNPVVPAPRIVTCSETTNGRELPMHGDREYLQANRDPDDAWVGTIAAEQRMIGERDDLHELAGLGTELDHPRRRSPLAQHRQTDVLTSTQLTERPL